MLYLYMGGVKSRIVNRKWSPGIEVYGRGIGVKPFLRIPVRLISYGAGGEWVKRRHGAVSSR
jgi:hypothetical protein